MANPLPITITDANGHSLVITGASSGTQEAAPTPAVLCDVNGNVLNLGSTPSLYDGGTFSIVEEFCTGQGNNGTFGVGAVFAFDQYWIESQIAAGTTGTFQRMDGTYQNPGTLLCTTPAVSGNGGAFGKGDFNGRGPLGALGANAGWQYDTWIQTPATITSYATRHGLASGTNQFFIDAPTGGVWVEFDTANASSNTNWTLRTVNASTSTFVSTGVAVAASTWYHIRISSVVAGTILCQIGVANAALGAAVSSSTNVDATNVYTLMMQIIPRTTAAVTITLDRITFNATIGRQ